MHYVHNKVRFCWPAATHGRQHVHLMMHAPPCLACGQVPWDLGREQDSLKIVAGDFTGRVLDAGCGLGNNSLWLGSLPAVTSVDAVDFSVDAIQEARARQAAAPKEAASKVTFTVADINNLPFNKGQPFDCLLDSAVFHCIGDDDAQKRYLAAVTPFIKLGGKAVMLVFSDKNPDPWFGPRRISQEHATKVWTAAGWRVDRITEATMHSNIPQLNAGILMQATRVA